MFLLTTTKAPRSYQEAEFTPDSWIFFGKETAGLPMDFREKFRDRCIRLPMISEARSLNLSNTVAVCQFKINLNFLHQHPLSWAKGSMGA